MKSKESFEKTRQVKKIDNSKKYILRGDRNTRYHEKLLSKKKKFYILTNFYQFLEDYNRYRAEIFNIH